MAEERGQDEAVAVVPKKQLHTKPKNYKREARKLVLWIVVACFVLLFSFALLVYLPELKEFMPKAFDNNVVGVFFLLVMMICVALIAFAAFLYRTIKTEKKQDEMELKIAEIEKGFKENALLYMARTIFGIFRINSDNTDENVNRANKIRVLLASVLIVIATVSFGVAIFQIITNSADTASLLFEAGGMILGVGGSFFASYFKSADERKKENEERTGVLLEEIIKQLPSQSKNEACPVLLWNPSCETCKKAKAYLDEKKITYTLRNIIESAPTYEDVKTWHSNSGLQAKSLFCATSKQYKEKSLKDKLPNMSVEECLEAIRPLVWVGRFLGENPPHQLSLC